MEAYDLLAHNVYIRRPILIVVVIFFIQEAQSRGVVEKGIHPDINHMTRIKIHRDAPFEAGAGNAQVLQARLDEIVDHFVHPAGRL